VCFSAYAGSLPSRGIGNSGGPHRQPGSCGKRRRCRQHRKGIGVRDKFEVTEALLNIEGFPFMDSIPHSISNTRSINKLDSYCRYLALEKVFRFGSIFSLEATLPAETDSGFYELWFIMQVNKNEVNHE